MSSGAFTLTSSRVSVRDKTDSSQVVTTARAINTACTPGKDSNARYNDHSVNQDCGQWTIVQVLTV